MATRMVHPRHGTTFAVGAEVEWNEKNGWKVEAKAKEPVAPPQADISLSDEELAAAYEVKTGERPHHRMKRETIEAALKE